MVDCASAVQDWYHYPRTELRRIRKCPTHPNNDQVPTKERKDITLIRLHYLDHLDHPKDYDRTLGHNTTKPPIPSHRTTFPLCSTLPHGASRTNVEDYVSADLGLRCSLVACQLGVGRFGMLVKGSGYGTVHFLSHRTNAHLYAE